MDESETTHAILREIRDQLKEHNSRFERLEAEMSKMRQELGGKIDETNRRIDRTNRQLVNMESRLSTEVSALRADVTDTNRHLVTLESRLTEPDERREFRQRLERCERDIAELRERG